jgi:hypothetical protein
MVHHAKVDSWVAASLGGLALLEVVAGVAVLVAGLVMESIAPGLALGIGLALTAVGVLFGLALWGCYGARYEVTPSEVIIRIGPFRSTLPLGSIVEVFPTRNPLGAPAPSLDRLQINYRGRGGEISFALISPKDKEGFVRDLASAAPRLRSPGGESLRLKADEPSSA